MIRRLYKLFCNNEDIIVKYTDNRTLDYHNNNNTAGESENEDVTGEASVVN